MEKDKTIIVVVGGGSVGTTIARIAMENPNALICHRGNLDTFEESIRPDLLRVIELEENKPSFEVNIEPLQMPILDIVMPDFHYEKKGKHTPKSKSKYLWKR